jgi:hypothetical protein
MPKSKLGRILGLIGGLIFIGCIGFIGYFLYFVRPVVMPPKAERAIIQQQAADYLAAWQRGDLPTMTSMMSSKSTFKKGKFPEFSGKQVTLKKLFWRPALPLGRIMVGAFIRQGNDWKHWPNGKMAFPVYEQGGVRYFLVFIKDGGEWMVLNGPGCDVPTKPSPSKN